MDEYMDLDLLFPPTEEQREEMERIEELQLQKKERAEHLENGKLYCPDCGCEYFRSSAQVTAILDLWTYEDGSQDYELFEWDYIVEISSYECRECKFYFEGDEYDFRDFLESIKNDSKMS